MPEMTSRERLLTALRGGQPDRVPIVVRGVNPYARHMNWRGEADPSYQPLLEMVRENCDVEHLWSAGRGFFLNDAHLPLVSEAAEQDGWRMVRQTLETPRGPLTAVHQVGQDGYASQATLKHWIATEEDVERFLALPYVPAQPDLAAYRSAVTELGERGYVLPYLDDPVGYVHALLGSETLAIWTVQVPHLLHRLLAAMAERLHAYLQALLSAGVWPVVGLQGVETVLPPLVSPGLFDDLVLRYDAPLVDLIHQHGCLVVMHCHGPLDAVLERFVTMGTDALHPVEGPPMGDVTLVAAKGRIGDSVCLMGNIQIGDIMECERAAIIEQTRAAVQAGAPGGGFILTLTATPFERVLSARTLENLQAMVETALEHGRYSLPG